MKRLTALGLALTALWLLQALLIPKYMAPREREGALIGEYYDFAGENDVVFIGDCEVYENFSPVTLWQEYGITSCIRGSPQQMIWQSYYLMEETFRYETPKVMVFCSENTTSGFMALISFLPVRKSKHSRFK